MKRKVLLLVILILFAGQLMSQNLSQKRISLSLVNNSAIEALSMINLIDGVKLSYNPDLITNKKLITINYLDETTEFVIKDILGEQYELKYRGSYIIIQKTSVLPIVKSDFKISGAVKDAETGEDVEDVTIYEVNKLSSTLTDDEGNFELKVSAKAENVTFAISHQNYKDTLVRVSSVPELSSLLLLVPVEVEEVEKIQPSRFEIETKKMVQFFTSNILRKNTNNVHMEEERPFQVSLVPMIGTNGLLSGQVGNQISINLLVGYSRGFNGFELGGFYNINRMDTKGLQIGGFGNVTGGGNNGVQFAGFINTNKGYTYGLQTAGFVNLVMNDIHGVQFAGFLNIAEQIKGSQISGFANMSYKNMEGLQLAGFLNIDKQTNYTQMERSDKRIKSTQLAGFSNLSKDLNGTQISGFINIAKKINGAQIAGFVNITEKLSGIQIGVVNIADTVESGTTIGLLNIVKSGKHQFSIENNDFMDMGISFRTGTDKFYSVLSSGINLTVDTLWAYGFGFGSQFRLKNKFYGNVELSAHNINNINSRQGDVNLLNRLDVNFGYQIGKNFSVNSGPVLNVYVTNVFDPITGVYGNDFDQYTFYSNTNNDLNISMRLGYAFSVRF